MNNYCVSCGAVLAPGDKFCAGCGVVVAPEEGVRTATPIPPLQSPPVIKPAPTPAPPSPAARVSVERPTVTAVGKSKLIVRKKKPTAFESLRGNIHITIGTIGIIIGAGLIISVAGIVLGAIILIGSLYITYQGKFIKSGVLASCPQCGNELKLIPPEAKEKCSKCSAFLVIEWGE